jgi:hypothetical protein
MVGLGQSGVGRVAQCGFPRMAENLENRGPRASRQDEDRTRTGRGQDEDRTRTGRGQDEDRTRTTKDRRCRPPQSGGGPTRVVLPTSRKTRLTTSRRTGFTTSLKTRLKTGLKTRLTTSLTTSLTTRLTTRLNLFVQREPVPALLVGDITLTSRDDGPDLSPHRPIAPSPSSPSRLLARPFTRRCRGLSGTDHLIPPRFASPLVIYIRDSSPPFPPPLHDIRDSSPSLPSLPTPYDTAFWRSSSGSSITARAPLCFAHRPSSVSGVHHESPPPHPAPRSSTRAPPAPVPHHRTPLLRHGTVLSSLEWRPPNPARGWRRRPPPRGGRAHRPRPAPPPARVHPRGPRRARVGGRAGAGAGPGRGAAGGGRDRWVLPYSPPRVVMMLTTGTVYALDRQEEPSAGFARVQARAGEELGTALAYRRVDVRDAAALNGIVEEIADRHGRLDGLIAAAGIQQETPALEYTAQDSNTMLSINVTGCFMTAQAAARQMIRFGNGGSIVMIASMSGTIANKVRGSSSLSPCVSFDGQMTRLTRLGRASSARHTMPPRLP